MWTYAEKTLGPEAMQRFKKSMEEQRVRTDLSPIQMVSGGTPRPAQVEDSTPPPPAPATPVITPPLPQRQEGTTAKGTQQVAKRPAETQGNAVPGKRARFDDDQRIRCDKCAREYVGPVKFKDHVRRHHSTEDDQKTACPICDMLVVRPRDHMETHIVGELKRYTCLHSVRWTGGESVQCGVGINTASSMRKHMKAEHGLGMNRRGYRKTPMEQLKVETREEFMARKAQQEDEVNYLDGLAAQLAVPVNV